MRNLVGGPMFFMGVGGKGENFCVSFFLGANFFSYPPQSDKEMLVANPFD